MRKRQARHGEAVVMGEAGDFVLGVSVEATTAAIIAEVVDDAADWGRRRWR